MSVPSVFDLGTQALQSEGGAVNDFLSSILPPSSFVARGGPFDFLGETGLSLSFFPDEDFGGALPGAPDLRTPSELGLLLAGGSAGGGGGGGGGRSLSPAAPLLASLFGARLGRRGFAPLRPRDIRRGAVPGGIFADLPAQLQEFMTEPLGLSAAEEDLFGTILDDPAFATQNLEETIGLLDQILGVGFTPTSAQPFFNEAIRQLGANVIPQIAEVAPGGIGSSGFIESGTRAGAELLGQAALAGVGLEEAFRNRVLGLAPIAGARGALPFSFAGDIFGLGQQRRNLLEAGRARPLSVFTTLAGLPAFPIQQGFPTQNTTAGILSALASNPGFVSGATDFLSGALGGLGSLFGGLIANPQATSTVFEGGTSTPTGRAI